MWRAATRSGEWAQHFSNASCYYFVLMQAAEQQRLASDCETSIRPMHSPMLSLAICTSRGDGRGRRGDNLFANHRSKRQRQTAALSFVARRPLVGWRFDSVPAEGSTELSRARVRSLRVLDMSITPRRTTTTTTTMTMTRWRGRRPPRRDGHI